jgi:predicted enzyme related to lactoylglutathione lyase
MFVDGLDAELDGIARRGIPVGRAQTTSGLPRRVKISDPDGNTIQLAELPGEGG